MRLERCTHKGNGRLLKSKAVADAVVESTMMTVVPGPGHGVISVNVKGTLHESAEAVRSMQTTPERCEPTR